MVFRVGAGQPEVRGRGARVPEVAVAAALRAFGADPKVQPDGSVRIGEHSFIYDASAEPHFIVVPECDRCGTDDIAQFPLETWELQGVAVRGQARTSCRDCRFIELATG